MMQYGPTTCGTSQFQFNPSQVREEMGHPVQRSTIRPGGELTQPRAHLIAELCISGTHTAPLWQNKKCLKSPGTPLKASSAHICPRTFETHFTLE